MANIVQIPGYGNVQFPDDMSQEDITDAIKNKILKPKAPPQEELGPLGRMGREFMHTIQSGYESAKAGIESTLEPDLEKKAEIFRKLQQQQEERERKEPSSLDFDKISKAYEQGIIPAAKEVLYQVPGAIGAGAASMIGAPVGAAIGSVVPGVGTALGAAAGMGATSFITQYGQNLQRQYEEQIKKGQKFDPEQLKAAGWAGASAALDVGAFEIPFGKIFGKIGTEAAEKLAKESVAKSLAKGAVIGPLTEVPTEIVQQMMERYQAGMDLTSDDAIKEYNETAAQVVMGFFPMGAAGRYIERGRAKSFLAEQERKEKEAKKLIPGQEQYLAQRQAEFEQADAERRRQEELEAREAAQAAQPMLALPAPPEEGTPERDVLGRYRQPTRFTTEQDTEALLQSSKTPLERTTAEQRGNQFAVVGESGVPIQAGFKTLEDAKAASDQFNQRIDERNEAQKKEESDAQLGQYVELANKIRNAGSIPIFPDTGIKSLIFNRRMNRQGQPNVLGLDVPFTTPAEIQALELNQDRQLTIVQNKKNGRVEVKSGGPKPGELNLSDRLLQGQEPGIDVAAGLTVPQKEEITAPEQAKEPALTPAAEKYLDQAQDRKDPTKFTPKNTEKVTNQLKALADKNGIELKKTVTENGVEKEVDKTPQDIVDDLVAKRNRQIQMAGVAREAPSEPYGPAPRAPRTAMQIGAEKAQRSEQIASSLKSAFDKLGLTTQGVKPEVVRYIADESGKEQRGAQAVEAEYNPHTKTITFASDIYNPNLSVDQIVGKMMDVLNHEVVHSLKEAGLFKAGEWKVLENYVKSGEGRKFLERAKLVYPDLNEAGQIEEAIAEASRAFNAGDFKPVGKPRNLFQRIINFFKGLFGAAKNNNTTPDQIFNAIRTGEIGGREAGAPAGGGRMQSRVGRFYSGGSSKATKQQIENADNVANAFNGKVVWQDGDTAIAAARSAGGTIEYYLVDKNGYYKSPIKSLKGLKVDKFSKEELEKLSSIADDIEKNHKEEYTKNPSIKFKNGVSFSDNFDKKLSSIASNWKNLLNIKNDIYFTTEKDAKENNSFVGPERHILFLTKESNTAYGIMVPYDKKRYAIVINNSLISKSAKNQEDSIQKTLETLAHEMGHAFEKSEFENSSPQTKISIQKEFDKWQKSNKGKTIKQHIESLRGPISSEFALKDITDLGQENLPATDLPNYHKYWNGFEEWFADQTARWAVSSEKPLSVVDKFFKNIADKLRRFFNTVRGRGFLPSNTFANYLDGIAESSKNTAASGSFFERIKNFFSQKEEGLPEVKQSRVGPATKEEAFNKLASDQRGWPETAMRDAQKVMGGIYSQAIEHAGDINHRISEYGGLLSGQGKGKVRDVLKLLRGTGTSYTFREEHDLNLKRNSDFYKTNSKDLSDKYDAALANYANEHKKLEVYNTIQDHAREAAISLGEKNPEKAQRHLEAIEKSINSGMYDQQVQEYNPDYPRRIHPDLQKKQSRVGPPGGIKVQLSTPQQQTQSNEINERLAINSKYLSKLTEKEGLRQVKGMRGWFKEFIDPFHALGEGADKYRIASGLLSGNMYKNINMARDYAEPIAAAKSDKKNIYDYLTTRDSSPDIIKDQKAREAAVKVKDIINKIGDEAVKLGLISPEQRERFRDQYLPRVLLAYSDRRKHVGAGKKPGFGYWRKSRADLTEEERTQLGEIQDPGFLVFESLFAPMRDMAILSFFNKINEIGGGKWVVGMNNKPVKGLDMNIQQVKVYADRLENAIKNGEISEDRIAESSAEVLRLRNAVEQEEERIGASVDRDKFIQMPKDTERYGPLAGLWVAKPIYRDVMGVGAFVPNNMSEFAALFADGGAVAKASSWFKLAKVAANPPTVFTNIISNALMMPFADVPYHRILPLVASTFKEIMMDKKGKYFDIAQNYGLKSTTLSEAELKNLYSELEKRATGGSDLNKITNLFYALVETAKKGGKKASDFYGDIETVFKAAIIKHGMESQGLTEEQAVLKANKYLFDYGEVHDSIKVLRNIPFGAPFLTWTYKMTPLLVETALTKPQKFIPYVALYYGIAQLATMAIMGAGGSEDDKDKLRKYLAKKTAENPFVLVTGPDSAFDFGKYMPFTNMYKFIANMAQGKPVDAFKEIGFFGGPVAELGIALTTGKDPFTNMDIIQKGGSPADTIVGWTNFIANIFMPPFMKDLPKLGAGYALDDPTMVAKSQSAVADTLKQIFGGTAGKQAGLPVKTEWEIAANYIGANVYHPSMQQFARNLHTMTKEMQDIKIEFRRNMQDPDLSQSDRNKIIAKYNQLRIDKQKEIMNYVKDSNLSPAVVKLMTDSIQATRKPQQ